MLNIGKEESYLRIFSNNKDLGLGYFLFEFYFLLVF